MKSQLKYISRLVLPLLLVIASVNVSAQKYGHLDSSELLASMTEWKDAERSIAQLQEKLKSEYETKLTSFQNEAMQFNSRIEAGTISQQEVQQEEQRLSQVQQSIGQFELDAQKQVLTQEESLLTPILDKAKNAIQAVAEESGYSYIFDSSTGGAILFSLPTENVLELVKAKL